MGIATVVKTIGTGRNFSTISAWESGAPANLTTAERWSAGTFSGTFTQGETVTGTGLASGKFLDSDGSSYVTFGITTGNSNTLVTLTGSTSGATCIVSTKLDTGIIWEGQAYNDFEFTEGVVVAGSTVSATCYVHLTVASGQSFQDNASVRTNGLRYNRSNGVGIKRTGAYTTIFNFASQNFTRLSRFQAQHTNTGGGIILEPASSSSRIKDCIFDSKDWLYCRTNTLINCLIISNVNSVTAISVSSGSGATFIGCTIVRPSNLTVGGYGIEVGAYSSASVLRSCAFFGFSAITTDTSKFTAASCVKNATNLASGLPGSGQKYSVTYNATTPFTQASTASNLDFRAIASTDLAANGSLDSTNAPNDISGTARTATPTIGVWELASTTLRKTINNIAIASVKTVNNLAIASVKTINNVT